MQALHIPATKETPEVRLDPVNMSFHLSGESYPENAMAFYAPVRASLQSFLESPALGSGGSGVQAHFNLRYFNSASTKLIRALVGMLQQKAAEGIRIVAHWHHDPDDDMMAEFGADLKDEFDAIEFNLVASETA
ncbi:MAG TPA: DUF1987 domain-containing protein, partial [Pseudothauera hydrothermalis]|nr:DUF1987 domain-containing protein [Pseudothauera hydrothermalis]